MNTPGRALPRGQPICNAYVIESNIYYMQLHTVYIGSGGSLLRGCEVRGYFAEGIECYQKANEFQETLVRQDASFECVWYKLRPLPVTPMQLIVTRPRID